MNPRLLAYLRSIGLDQNATEEQAQEFLLARSGVQANIANALNYNEGDTAARTNCDVMIRALGFDPANPAQELVVEPTPARTVAGSDGASLGGDLEEAARRAGQEAERQRCREIRQLGVMSGASNDLVEQLVNDGESIENARNRLFEDHTSRTRASVPADIPGGQAPAGHVRGGITLETIQAAVLHSRGLDPTTTWAVNENGTPRVQRMTPVLERAIDEAYQHRSASLEDIIRMCAQIDGVDLPSGRGGLLPSYLDIRSGNSTAALSAVFTTNVNSELLAAFQTAEDSTTGGWVRESDVSNFQTNERARMENGGALKKLPRGGEADHESYDDNVETFKIARYAKQFVIDEQDIIDDNFGGLTGFVPSDMGVAARQLRADLIYSLLLANANMRDGVALFHTATHGNLQTSSALGINSLKTARSNMRIQQENGRNLNIAARFLIVPTALEDDAEALVSSPLLITGEDATKGNRNPNANKGITVVSDARLDNGVTDPTDGSGGTVHAGSATTWFLASVASNHTIECAYRRGTGRAPQIRSKILTEGRWGLGWDVNMDIGAKALDWRGLSKNTA